MTCQICLKRPACRAVPIKQLTYPRELTLYVCMDCDKFVREARRNSDEQAAAQNFTRLDSVEQTILAHEERLTKLEELWTRLWEPDL